MTMAGILESPRWRVAACDVEAERRISTQCGVTPLVARVLASRGITSCEDAQAFLTPSLDRDWLPPLDIPGMGEAADRVEQAITRGETIAVFGDFDVDGMTSTCLLTLGLRALGAARVEPFIPDRFDEGYGLSQVALGRVIEACSPDLVVTVDNGIAAANEVEWLLAQGVDVVITDHHEPADLVPRGVPVADPKIDEQSPSRELAGAGVALKLVCELGARLGQGDLWRRYTDVATLGTISDMMLLTGENRALVAEGIARMRQTDRPGLVALAAIAGIDLAEVTSDSLPFSLVPRLNAAGRMGCTDIAFKLLLTDDPAEAATLAGQLEKVNQERRDIESALAEEALAKARASYAGERCVVVAGEGWHEGVKGIVASRIVGEFHVPAILFSISEGVARGSGRSVGSVDLFHAVEQCSDLLVRFGGHAGAVGVTVLEENLDAFAARLASVLAELDDDQFQDTGEVSAIVSLDELTLPGILALDALQPFGQGNRKPLLAARGVLMRNRGCVGADGAHLRFLATDGVSTIPAIMFRTPQIERAVGCDGAVDIVFEAVAETWQGRTKPKLMVRDIIYRDDVAEAEPSAAPSIADDLLSRASEILARSDFASLAEARSFNTKAVGVSFGNRQEVIAHLADSEVLLVERELDNPADPCACALKRGNGEQVGYLRRQIAEVIAPIIDAGGSYIARIQQVTGGEEGQSRGVNLSVERVDAPEEARVDASRAQAERSRLAALAPDELTSELRRALIGDHQLLPAQELALGRLGQGRSTLCVMATGRGKSLIFHIHAAREAIARGRASVFVYPLRALVADQSFHLQRTFEELGMGVEVLTGETSLDARDETFGRLASGQTDIILTTPEFLVLHVDRFAQAGRVGFVVIDEAHHAGAARSGNRSAYQSLPEVLETLSRPVCLAVTATAATPIAREIMRLAGIAEDDVIVDASVRENLDILDKRALRDRDAALISLVASGEKCVVYVNSREQSVAIARMLRRAIPDRGQAISFYNASLTRSERTAVEEAFRSGQLTCIISTSAFGEGVNLPDIRHVVLYHMPFGAIEFNQMSGRAGRDGQPADVTLLFGPGDARINERILASQAPPRSELVTLYRALTGLMREAAGAGEDSFSRTNAEIAESARTIDGRTRLEESAVSCGIGIFRELGFLSTSGFSTARRIQLASSPQHMDLASSTRYTEGQRSCEEFDFFKEWALSASREDMLARINRPIVPSFGTVVD